MDEILSKDTLFLKNFPLIQEGTKYIQLFLLDTISNITSLQILDISGNSLLDKVFIDEDNGTSIFGHLPNLTHLYLHDNRFTQV